MSSRGCARRPREKSLFEGPRSAALSVPCESRRSRPRADLASPPGVRFIFLDGNGKCLPRISPPFEMPRRATFGGAIFGEKRETGARPIDREIDRVTATNRGEARDDSFIRDAN